MRAHPCFLDREAVGLTVGGPCVPIIGIAAQRHHHLVRGDAGDRLADLRGEPVLRGDGAGGAAGPMLVIGHQEHLVGHLGEVVRVPVRTAQLHGDAHQTAVFVEIVVGFLDQAQIGGDQLRRHRFEIIDDAAIAGAIEIGFQLGNEGLVAARIAQQGYRGRAGEIVAHHILQHRHHQRMVDAVGQNAAEGFVFLHLQDAVLVHRQRGGHHPIELADMLDQRLRAFVGPGGVEADVDRRGVWPGVVRFGRGAEDRRQAARQPPHLRAERQRGHPFKAERQGVRCGDRHHRGGERHRQRHQRDQQREYPAPRPAAAAARGIVENRP